MTTPDLYVIGDRRGFTPQISRLVSMMDYVRHTTLSDVEGMSVEELDYLHDAESNSIGALLSHLAAVEVWYQAATFRGRELDAGEERSLSAALDLGEKARREIRGKPLSDYVGRLKEIRAKTLEELAHRDDAWLEQRAPFWGGQPANNYFKWFHVFEDELNHRGQIRWLRKRATEARKSS